MAAVDLYSKYPFPETLSFDDAYLHGEIVRLLMKQHAFDNPQLRTSLIAYVKGRGIVRIVS